MPDREHAARLWESVLAQEGEAPDPLRSIGRGALAEGELPLAADELPLLSDAELELGERIGQGGMGAVDAVLQRSLRRPAALKRLLPEAEPADAEALIREALHLGALQHPNVINVHQLGRDEEGRPQLLMQRVSGVEWRELIEDPEHPRWEELPQDRLGFHLDVLRQVCNALHFAHSRGILHRDVKPANVMLGRYGEVYLLDWGLSVRLEDPPRERPGDAPIVGTPAYFAPELVDPSLPLSARTDVYLLGATLHHALTGRPRHDVAAGQSVVYAAYRSEPLDYPAEVPAELAALCNAATARDPAQRPASALEFRQRLEAFLQHRGAVRTAERAEGALAELRQLHAGGGERDALLAAFTAARLGFRQALEDWPENEAARAGLQATLELRIEHELAQRNKGSAEELLGELPQPNPELSARLARLRDELAEEALSRARLDSIREDLDVTAAGRPRASLFLLVGALAGGGMIATAAAIQADVIELTGALKRSYQLLLPLVFAIGVFAFRGTLLRTSGARKIAACAGLLTLSPALSTAVSAAIQPEIKTALASVFQTTILTVMAIAFDRRIGWIALATAAVAAGCVAWPARWLEIQGVGTVVAFAIAARVTQPRANAPTARPPE